MRYLALHVKSEHPLRFRLVREACQGERTDYPRHVVLNLNIDAYVPVVTVRPGLCEMLVTEAHGIEVENQVASKLGDEIEIPSSFV